MPDTPTASVDAVEIDAVGFTYPPGGVGETGVEALRGITLNVEPGSRLGILGPNGGGKSTLIKLILGMLEPTAGQIGVFGHSPDHARRDGLVGYLPQRIGADLDWPLNVEQVVAMPLHARKSGFAKLSDEDQNAINRAIELREVNELRRVWAFAPHIAVAEQRRDRRTDGRSTQVLGHGDDPA